MALLDEANPAAEAAKRAKFRTNHVGTKLNAGELAELEALALKRGVTHGELIRGLILGEVAREKEPVPAVRPSVELEEITVLRLLLTNVLPKLATGETMTLEAYKGIVAEMKPPLRTKSFGMKVSEEEFAALEARARGVGLTLSEWVRDVLLSAPAMSGPDSGEVALAEGLALRSLIVNLHPMRSPSRDAAGIAAARGAIGPASQAGASGDKFEWGS